MKGCQSGWHEGLSPQPILLSIVFGGSSHPVVFRRPTAHQAPVFVTLLCYFCDTALNAHIPVDGERCERRIGLVGASFPIALRLTNSADQSKIRAALPSDGRRSA